MICPTCSHSPQPGYVDTVERAWTLAGAPRVMVRRLCPTCGGAERLERENNSEIEEKAQ